MKKTCYWCEGGSGFAGFGPLKTRMYEGDARWFHDTCFGQAQASDARDASIARQEANIRELERLLAQLKQAMGEQP